MRTLRLIRRSLLAAWTAMLLAVLGSVLLSHAIGLSGRQSFIIRGGSMEPTIPLGSLVAVANVAVDAIAPGDIVTMRQGDHPVITHRVIRLMPGPDGSMTLVTKGDANTHTDGAAVPASAVLGRVEAWIPVAGYLMAILSNTGGMVSVLTGMGSMLLALKLLEDEEAEGAPHRVVLGPAPLDASGAGIPGLT